MVYRNREYNYTVLSASLSLVVFALGGCATTPATSQQKTNRVTTNTAVLQSRNSTSSNPVSGQLSNSTAASQQVSTKVSQAGAVELAAKPITLVYGGTKYQLSVPAADSGGKQTNVSAVVVPGGIVWIPGGSSIGVVVSDPKNPSEKVTLWMNACAGCYSPSVVSAELVTAPDSPLLGAQKGESYTWLNDHAVTYTLPPSKKSKYPTYGLTRTFTGASGDEEVTVTVPARDKQTATDILNSVLSRPSRHA